MDELREALQRLLECAELNQDNIEPATLVAIDLAQEALARAAS